MRSTGFHEGELAVQDRAGVRALAARLGAGMLATPDLSGGMAKFLGDREFAVLTARGTDGRLWTSPVFAAPGFLRAGERELRILASPRAGDPLAEIGVGARVGMIAIEFATRRRVRVNGTVTRADADGLVLSVDQAYGNCPQYIHRRHLERTPPGPDEVRHRVDSLQPHHVSLITRADTFFLGTAHPDRGADASHRGGEPGFVRVEGDDLWWPDYPGNNMFNSLGNIAVDPSAALLFIDFDSGATLQLSGAAAIEWDGTGRGVRFHVESGCDGQLGLRARG